MMEKTVNNKSGHEEGRTNSEKMKLFLLVKVIRNSVLQFSSNKNMPPTWSSLLPRASLHCGGYLIDASMIESKM